MLAGAVLVGDKPSGTGSSKQWWYSRPEGWNRCCCSHWVQNCGLHGCWKLPMKWSSDSVPSSSRCPHAWLYRWSFGCLKLQDSTDGWLLFIWNKVGLCSSCWCCCHLYHCFNWLLQHLLRWCFQCRSVAWWDEDGCWVEFLVLWLKRSGQAW